MSDDDRRLKSVAFLILTYVLFCLVTTTATLVQIDKKESKSFNLRARYLQEDDTDVGSLILDWSLILVLITLSALFSGLTLGLMSLDTIGLEIVMGGDSFQDAENARKIYPLRKNGNLLLCTLLLGNTCVNATLSVLLASYSSGVVGIIVSTGLIVVFGEIIPQATCSRHALLIGAKTRYIVYIFMVIMFPVAKPISLAIGYCFGAEVGSLYTSKELTKLLEIHAQKNLINNDTVKIMKGTIDFEGKYVADVMTPKQNMFMLDAKSKLDFTTMTYIFQSGHSRIPVYNGNKNSIVGLLLTKDLILIDPEDAVTVDSVITFIGRPVEFLWDDNPLKDALALFKTGRGHLAIVKKVNNEDSNRDPFYEVVGLITLEDIIEEIIQDEIIDETDQYVNIEDPKNKINRERFDADSLRYFISHSQCNLTPEEKASVCKLLITFVEPFKIFKPTLEKENPYSGSMKVLIDNCMASVLKMKGQQLYRRGRPVRQFTLILEGKLKVNSGSEGFESEVGKDSWLGSSMLLKEGTLLSDFSATCLTDVVKCVRILKRDFDLERQKLIKATKENGLTNGLTNGKILNKLKETITIS